MAALTVKRGSDSLLDRPFCGRRTLTTGYRTEENVWVNPSWEQASLDFIEARVFLTESLILAQDKRWRRVLGMQVERES